MEFISDADSKEVKNPINPTKMKENVVYIRATWHTFRPKLEK